MLLYPYQQTSIDLHLQARYSLNGSEPGLGKSRIALETFRRSGAKCCLVFGPAFLRQTWLNEAERWGVEIDYCSYAGRVPVFKWDFVICDEVHYAKNPNAQRTKQLYAFIEFSRPDFFLGLSGTPIRNRVYDLYTAIDLCSKCPTQTNGQHFHKATYKSFADYFCHRRKPFVPWGPPQYYGFKQERAPVLRGLLEGKYIAFKTEDVLAELPSLTIVEVPLGLKDEDPALAEAFHAYAVAGGSADIRSKVASATIKTGATVEYCKNLAAQDSGPILIFTDHINSALLIAKGLGVAAVTGNTPVAKREAIVLSFQAGQSAFLVATIGTMATGYTLTAARHVVFNDQSWVPADNQQAMKRIHRIGQHLPCFAHYIDATRTDALIRSALNQKQSAIDGALAGASQSQ